MAKNMFRLILFFILASAAGTLFGDSPQQTLRLTLEDAMMRARLRSVDAEVALNRLRSAWWAYRSYRAELLPEIGFRSAIPSYRKQYSPYMDAGGNYSFVRNNYLELNGEISMTQNIWLTGGSVSLTTSLDFYRQLGQGAYSRFMSIPVALTLTQPIFGVNHVRWDRRIEPVRYAEAQAEFLSATEDVAASAMRLYFALLMARENRSIAKENLGQAKRLYDVACEKREMGHISRNDLLQMELNLLEAESTLTDCESEMKNAMFLLRTFLGYDMTVELEPEIPDAIPGAVIEFHDALDRALTNNSFAKRMMRLRLESDYDLAKAKGEQREISLFAQFGYTAADHSLSGSYSDLKDNQVVEVGVSIPILDWGRRKGKVKVAESNRRLVESQIRLEEQNFSQDLFILVERYANQREQLERSRRADEIASRRYVTNVETYMIGSLSTLDLNDSRLRKDEARRAYVNELYLFWDYYYRIRSLTLWDYERECGIHADIEGLLNR